MDTFTRDNISASAPAIYTIETLKLNHAKFNIFLLKYWVGLLYLILINANRSYHFKTNVYGKKQHRLQKFQYKQLMREIFSISRFCVQEATVAPFTKNIGKIKQMKVGWTVRRDSEDGKNMAVRSVFSHAQDKRQNLK